MWWIYFNTGAERASDAIARADDPGRLGGLLLHLSAPAAWWPASSSAAVGDELVLSHPTGHTDAKTAAVLLAGPALYLVGNLLFKRASANSPALSHMIGLGLLALVAPAAMVLNPVAFSAATTLVLVLVAVWETLSLRTVPAPLVG